MSKSLDFPIGPAIWVWDYNHLPDVLKCWMNEHDMTVDDIDWIAVVPPEYKDDYINWLEEPIFGCYKVDNKELSPEGHRIIAGYHS